MNPTTTEKQKQDKPPNFDVFITAGGVILLFIVFVPYLIRVVFFIKWVAYDKTTTWVWSSVSVSCSKDVGPYILATICSYTALYLSAMYTLEHASASSQGDLGSTICYILDLLALVALCGVGIFPTSFHFGIKPAIHFICAGLFFAIIAFTNIRWLKDCYQAYHPQDTFVVQVAKAFAISTLVLGAIFVAFQLYMTCCLRRFHVVENTECIIDEDNRSCEECGRERLFPLMNFLSFISELGMIISIVFGSLLETLITNRWFKYIGLNIDDPSNKTC